MRPLSRIPLSLTHAFHKKISFLLNFCIVPMVAGSGMPRLCLRYCILPIRYVRYDSLGFRLSVFRVLYNYYVCHLLSSPERKMLPALRNREHLGSAGSIPRNGLNPSTSLLP